MKCLVRGCTRTHRDAGVSFHRLPGKDPVRSRWLEALRLRANSKILHQLDRVCSEHFSAQSFTSWKVSKNLGFERKKKRLDEGSVPTLQLNLTPAPACKRRRLDDSETPSECGKHNEADNLCEDSIVVSKEDMAASIIEVVPAEQKAPETQDCSELQLATEDHGYSIRSATSADHTYSIEVQYENKGTQVNLSAKQSKETQTDPWEFPAVLPCTSAAPAIMRDPAPVAMKQVPVPAAVEMPACEDFATEQVAPSYQPTSQPFLEADLSFERPGMCSSPIPEEPADTTYEASWDESFLSNSTSTAPLHEEPKYIVFESCLLQLLRVCIICQAPCKVTIVPDGTLVRATAVCQSEHSRTWLSQPLINNVPACNLLLSGAMLFTGSCSAKVLRLLRLINIQAFSESTYFNHQAAFLQPAIERVWIREQQSLLQARQGKTVRLAGDGRYDSPGYSAKFMTYTFMEMETNKILHYVQVQLGESPEVKSSNAMELHGCAKGLTFFKEEDVTVEALVTDRHLGIKGHMRSKEPQTRHYFDAWHIAKGISKKMLKASKYARCEVLAYWAQPASNHLYWCAANCEEDGKLLVEMWKSINNHALDKHTGHGGVYDRCVHDTLVGDREWLSLGTPAHKRFVSITMQKVLLRDLEHVSPAGHTYNLESYHSMLIRFAPKSVAFTGPIMHARTRLAALHHNENSGRVQAVTRKGQPKFKRRMQRGKMGTDRLKEVKTPPTYAYVGQLLSEAAACCSESSLREALGNRPRDRAPLPMAAHYPRLPKEQLVEQRMSRYSRGTAGSS
ncbi:uncharacterized protein LOC115313580 [Ixodes scapularis]|uniref:uncharacterized protein LOC115313580 n=1 Tax=Ixodes scapularis TaxID=6945 RepID=UPI001A9F8730|nr:uncharacterized protein LOC115313580 [Ixodes scapularis]